MKFLKQIALFLVYSNVWIALGATAFTWKWYLTTNTTVNYSVLGFVFASTVLTYTFQRYVKMNNKNYAVTDRFNWMSRNAVFVKIVLLLSLLTTLWCSFYLQSASFYLLVLLGFISFFYVVKIFGRINLRSIPTLKIFLIAIVWAATSNFLPPLNSAYSLGFSLLLHFFLIDFLFILAITIPFDVRDLTVDEKSKMTLPQLIGVKKSLVLAVLLILTQALLFGKVSIVLVSIIGAILILKTNKNSNDLYFSFWIDGLLILQTLALFIELNL